MKGCALKGALAEIPGKWEELNAVIAEKKIEAEAFFGVCLSMENGLIHYIAGIDARLAEGLIDTEEVLIPGGKYIVAPVEGGIPAIPTTFNQLLRLDNLRMQEGYAIERYKQSADELLIEVLLPVEE